MKRIGEFYERITIDNLMGSFDDVIKFLQEKHQEVQKELNLLHLNADNIRIEPQYIHDYGNGYHELTIIFDREETEFEKNLRLSRMSNQQNLQKQQKMLELKERQEYERLKKKFND